MRRSIILILLVVSSTLLWVCPVKAEIIEIQGYILWPTIDNPPWIFDYDLQTLTAIGNVHLLPGTLDYIGAYYEPWGYALLCRGGSINEISGSADSDSVFHINATYKNETGIAWTAWLIQWDAPFVPEPTPLADVVYAGGSKLTDATYDIGAPAEPGIVLTGDPVLPGEVFTIELDVYVDEGGFYDRLGMVPIIPEPATIVLLGLGGIGMICRRRRSS